MIETTPKVSQRDPWESAPKPELISIGDYNAEVTDAEVYYGRTKYGAFGKLTLKLDDPKWADRKLFHYYAAGPDQSLRDRAEYLGLPLLTKDIRNAIGLKFRVRVQIRRFEDRDYNAVTLLTKI